MAESTQCSQRRGSPPPKNTTIQMFTDASNVGSGAHLEQDSIKGLWSGLYSQRFLFLELVLFLEFS